MKERAIEVLFRHKFIILLPILIIMPLMIMLAAQPRPKIWQSFAVIWIDQYKPLYSDDRLGYTPAANQAQLLNDFMRTRSFALDTLSKTRRADQLTNPQNEFAEMQRFWLSVRAWASSNNFITIGVSANDPELALEIASAVVQTFRETLSVYLQERSQASIGLYAETLTKAEQDLGQARAELSAYVAANASLINARTEFSLPLEARDAAYARLLSRVQSQQDRYAGLLRRYEELQTVARVGATSQDFAFTLVDEPQPPIAPVPQSRLQPLKFPLVGFTMAIILSSAIALFLIFTNRTVLGGRDLNRSLGVPVLGEIPELRWRRWFWQRGPRDAVRQRLAKPARLATFSGEHAPGTA